MALDVELRERVQRGTVHLMPQPQTALRLRNLVADPNHTLPQVVEAVALDPMLAAAVMRLANSAGVSRGQITTSLTAAVTRIGEKDLERLALASGLGPSTTAAGPLLALRRRAMQDSLASALLCERLAPEFGLDVETCFLEGLLHDVGAIVALGTLEIIVAQRPRSAAMSAEGWLALAEQHHVELGMMLSSRWQLPVRVRQVIETHHAPQTERVDAAAVVRMSDGLLALIRQGEALTEEALPWLERVPAERRAALLARLAEVPSVLAAFEGERPAGEASPLVLAPPRAEVPPQGLWLPARLTGDRTGEALLLSATQLLIRTKQRVPDNHLAELELALPDEKLKLWVRFTFSGRVGVDGLAEAEATAFAPTREVSQRLQSLWSAMEVLEVAA